MTVDDVKERHKTFFILLMGSIEYIILTHCPFFIKSQTAKVSSLLKYDSGPKILHMIIRFIVDFFFGSPTLKDLRFYTVVSLRL